jgi:hypothetical protein
MNLKEIYVDKKQVLDSGYMDWYNSIKESIENDDEYSLSDDELDELIGDLMISNILGRVIQYNEVSDLIDYKPKK